MSGKNSSVCYADIYAGGNINGLAIIKGSKTMDVGKALDLIHRTYNALHKGHWEDGESESELCESINDYMSGIFGLGWSE